MYKLILSVALVLITSGAFADDGFKMHCDSRENGSGNEGIYFSTDIDSADGILTANIFAHDSAGNVIPVLSPLKVKLVKTNYCLSVEGKDQTDREMYLYIYDLPWEKNTHLYLWEKKIDSNGTHYRYLVDAAMTCK